MTAAIDINRLSDTDNLRLRMLQVKAKYPFRDYRDFITEKLPEYNNLKGIRLLYNCWSLRQMDAQLVSKLERLVENL